MQLLMVDGAAVARKSWISALKANGFCLDLFETLAGGREAVELIDYQVVLVNSRLPDGDGIAWVSDLRSTDQKTPFMVLAPTQDVETRIRALDHGADDCVTDALDSRELVAKVRALLRRSPIVRSSVVETGNLQLDVVRREISVNGVPLVVPRRELGILEHLMMAFNRTLTREYLDASIYGASGEVCPNSIEVRVSRLRRCLAQAKATVEIKTLRGIGYRLQPID